MPGYKFTTDWFSQNIPVWERIFSDFKPESVLEIGSYEGRSAVWMAEMMHNQLNGGHIDCIDTWPDGDVQNRFEDNIKIAQWKFPGVRIRSYKIPSYEIAAFKRINEYDLVYIDGSHKASEVLSDAVDAYHLCRHGGVIIFDDYNNGGASADNPLDLPKIAVDAFLKCFGREVEIIHRDYQLIVRKK